MDTGFIIDEVVDKAVKIGFVHGKSVNFYAQSSFQEKLALRGPFWSASGGRSLRTTVPYLKSYATRVKGLGIDGGIVYSSNAVMYIPCYVKTFQYIKKNEAVCFRT